MPVSASASAPPPLVAHQRNAILGVLLAGAAVAWVAVVRRADEDGHAGMDAHGAGATLDLTMGMGPVAYLAMWVAMMAAMMFPAAAPMILTFARVQQSRRARGTLYVPTATFVAVYLALWGAFGVAAFAVSAAVEEVLAGTHDVASAWGRVTGGVLVVAGAYQLSPLKDRCLSACRGPLAFFVTSWRPGIWGAVRLGLQHGLHCVGCCWLLFVVLIVLGVVSVAAMLVVALVVFAEKTLPGARRIARGTAAVMIALGILGLAAPSAVPTAVT